MRHWCAVLALTLVAAVATATGGRASLAETPRKRATASTVGVISASSASASIRVVNDLAAALDSDTLRILPVAGQGPVRNITDLFQLKGADVAITPSDVLPYLRREGRLPDAEQSLFYIAAIDREEVHILARQDIASVADLAGKKVGFGPRDSRSYVTGTVLFDNLQIGVEPVLLEPSQALQALRRGEIAALVYVARKPARLFFGLNRTDGVHFLPLPRTPALSNIYRPAGLNPEDYPLLIGGGEAGRGTPVPTVAVPMVLAVRDAAPGTELYRDLSRFTDSLFLRAPALQALSGDTPWSTFDPVEDVPGWRRFPAAETRLRGEVAVGSGTSAPSTASRPRYETPEEREALFRRFLQQYQRQHPEDRSSPRQKLYDEFLRSGEGR